MARTSVNRRNHSAPAPDEAAGRFDGGPTTHAELLKVEYAGVMDELHRCAKRFGTPGVRSGIPELAVLIDRNAETLQHQLAPTDYEHAPTAHCLLQVLEALGPAAAPAVNEIAALADCITIPRSLKAQQVGAMPGDDWTALDFLPARAHYLIRPTSAKLKAGHKLSAAERAEIRTALHDVIAYAAHLLTRFK